MLKTILYGWTTSGNNQCVTKNVLVRRLIILLLTIAFLHVSARGVSQTVSYQGKQVALKTVFSAVEKQTGFVFLYSKQVLEVARPVTLNARRLSLPAFLEMLFRDQPLEYSIHSKSILVSCKSTAAMEVRSDQFIHGANKGDSLILVKGTVYTRQDGPAAGATVKVKGTKVMISSGNDGQFTVSAKIGDTLVVSYVGFESRFAAVKAANMGLIYLQPSISRLDETVIIAYGSTSRRLSTSDIARVNADDIAKQPVTNPLQALQGRMPGVLITPGSGVTGSKAAVQIRGQNFIGNTVGRNDPLYIVDGVPFPATALNKIVNGSTAADGATGETSPMNAINPTDIESIEVLKDADATAIYGSRGANGVILITTKSGKAGKTTFNTNVWTGRSNVSHFVDVLSTDEYRSIRQISFQNGNTTPTAANAPDLLVWDPAKTTDFQKMLIGGTMSTTDVNTSISGGDFNNKFYLSGSYHKENTVFASDQGYNRASILLKSEHGSLDGRFKVVASVQYSSDKNNLSATDPTGTAYTLPPNYHLYNPDGSLYWFGIISNPMAQLKVSFNNNTTNLIGHTLLKYTIIPGLDVKTSLGYNKSTQDQIRLTPAASYNPAYNVTSGSAIFTDFNSESFIIEPQITYSKIIGNGHLDVLAGGTWQTSTSKMPFQLLTSGFLSDDLLSDPQAAANRAVYTAYTNYKYASIFGRVTYNYNGKYILNGVVRRDGSSRFGPDKQFGNFGSLGAAWLFSEEEFAKKIPGLSFGKLRGSYGVSGNDQIPDYQYASLYQTTTSYGAGSALVPSGIANPLIHWEVNRKLEAGLELGFLKDRILFGAAWYRNRSDNQLANLTLSPQAGFSSFTANMPALVQNTGVEFTLTSVNINKGSFKYSTSLNLTIPRNKLVYYPDLKSAGNSALATTYAEGYPLSSIFVLKYTGDDPKTGLPTFKDMDKNGSITSGIYYNGNGDYVYGGATFPAFYGGLSNNISYKGFQLDIFIQFTKQKGRSLATSSYYPPGNALYANMSRDVVYQYLGTPDKWANNPKISRQFGSAYTAYANWAASDANLVDASFVRLKNINFSYSLSASTLSRLHVHNLRVYIQGQNLLTITNYKGFDPETQSISLPPLRILTAGIQLTI